MKKNGGNDKENASFSTLLADAMERAERASRIERATRWGTRVLWGGGVGVVAAVWRCDQVAPTAGSCVAIVLLAALCVGFLGALKPRSRARDRRASALLAARRLERRFPGLGGVWVAAVDFCEEETREPLEKKAATSDVLRAATVEAARREYAELAATLDEAELFAVLTETPRERFRKRGKRRRLLALGVLINVAVWVNAVNWEKERAENKTNVGALAPENGGATIPLSKVGENKEDEKNGEGNRERERIEANDAAQETENQTADEETSLLMWELLISELAQNAEIAEALEAELERAVGEERETDEENATTFLQLARELNANLARPETGLVAQTRRLGAAIGRERQKIDARRVKIERLDALRERGEDKEIGKIEEAGENSGEFIRVASRATGREVAVFLTTSRLAELETRLTAAGGVGDWATLELSRVLRSKSAAERKKILAEAAARVGEWGTTLRREETAARILSESWRFDAASRRRTTLVKRAEQENRLLLTRFAGRLNVEFGALDENDEELEKAKRCFSALWEETRAAEKERVVIVERLRERLQNASAQDFIAFVREDDVFLRDWELGNVEADEAIGRAFDETTSQNEERWKKIAKDVENNRFGRAAERLADVASSEEKTPLIFDENKWKASVDIKEIGDLGEGEASVNAFDDSQERRRFFALAAALTLGVDVKTTRRIETQTAEKEDFALAEDDPRKKNAALKEGNEAGGETSNKEDGENGDEALSPNASNGEKKRAFGKENGTSDDVNAEKTNVVKTLSNDEGKNGAVASGEESENENGATASNVSGGSGGKEEKNEKAEVDENKAFNVELPPEARRRFEGTNAPEILPEYEEKIRLYRRRILEERR